MRLLSCVLCCELFGSAASAQWADVKGQVVFPAEKPFPKREPLNLGANPPACLKGGQLLDESLLVNPKNRGIKNVVVWLRPNNANNIRAAFAANEIHPKDANRKAAEVVIDQPCCSFIDRVTVARVGDKLTVKNSAAFNHNFFWDSTNNGSVNVNIAASGKHEFMAPLAAEPAPVQFKCTVHPWMTGYVRIFDHPYYAVTDDDGKFEIKNAPVGMYRIVMWHETGLRGGRAGRFGDVIPIAGPTTELKPVEFDISPK